MKVFEIFSEWDAEAKVWYIAKSDVPGLATEAKTIEKLNAKLMVMVPELLILNGVLDDCENEHIEVPYELMAKKFQMARAGC